MGESNLLSPCVDFGASPPKQRKQKEMNSQQQQLLDKINEDIDIRLDVDITGPLLTPEQFLEIYKSGYLAALDDVTMFVNMRR